MFQLLRISLVFILLSFVPLTLSGCAPTDEHVLPYQDRLSKGLPIVYNRYGEQHIGCRNSWSDVRLSEKEIEDLFFLGSLATPGFGDNNCLTVGTEIQIKNTNTDKFIDATAVVQKVIIWNGNGPEARQYKDHVKWSLNNFSGTEKEKQIIEDYVVELFNSSVMSKQKASHTGIVHITHIDLANPGSEAQRFAQKGRQNFQSSLIDETRENGDHLSYCNRTFTDFRTSKETWELILSGKTQTAWDVQSGLLCVKQGEVVEIKSSKRPASGNEADREVFGKIKIGKMRRMVLEQFKPEFIRGGTITPEEAAEEIHKLYEDKANDPRVRLLLFDFELLEGSASEGVN